MSKNETKEKYEINDLKFYNCIADLINNDNVLKMENFIQHGKTTCLNHCLRVSYQSYKLAKKLNLDYKATARAALLHDLFLYDWHKAPKARKFLQKHGYSHPSIALENAKTLFTLTSLLLILNFIAASSQILYNTFSKFTITFY